MRNLTRDKRSIEYCKYIETIELTDEHGYQTGEKEVLYSQPISIEANVSSAKGSVQVEMFGSTLEYDRVILIDNMSLCIKEEDLIFIDSSPIYTNGVLSNRDFKIERISITPNVVAIAVSKFKK